jgi:hypothetical protein
MPQAPRSISTARPSGPGVSAASERCRLAEEPANASSSITSRR